MALYKYVYYYYYYYYYHKAAGRKTRLGIHNYGCNGNLLCYHDVVERNRISSLQSHGKAYYYPCIIHTEEQTEAGFLASVSGK